MRAPTSRSAATGRGRERIWREIRRPSGRRREKDRTRRTRRVGDQTERTAGKRAAAGGESAVGRADGRGGRTDGANGRTDDCAWEGAGRRGTSPTEAEKVQLAPPYPACPISGAFLFDLVVISAGLQRNLPFSAQRYGRRATHRPPVPVGLYRRPTRADRPPD